VQDLITESDVETKLANIAEQILKTKDHLLHHQPHDTPLYQSLFSLLFFPFFSILSLH
jgi:hypothetical protein